MSLPKLCLHDLKPRDRRFKIKLSILMTINDYRQVQVARSLECLCRQTWPGFEVMIAHTEGLDGMDKIIETFSPFLELRNFPLPRDPKRYCPTLGFKTMMPEAKGEVIAIMQPEVMLDPAAAEFLYFGHFKKLEETLYWRLNTGIWSQKGRPTFVNFKVGFISNGGMPGLDNANWRSDVHNVRTTEFWSHKTTLSDSGNPHMLSYYEFPWWFVGSALTNDPIWRDMHIFEGHAAIDLWMIRYRHIHNYVEVNPLRFMGYHQAHKITATSTSQDFVLRTNIPESDPSTWIPMNRDELIERCTLYGVIGLDGSETDERLAHCLLKARKHTVGMVERYRNDANLPFEPPKLPMPWGLNARLL